MSLICHIGFPKTGSTYLQESVFPEMQDVHYITWNKDVLEAFYEIVHYDESYFDLAKCKRIIKENASGNLNLCSYEPFTGYHHHSRFSNRTQIARRLKEIGVEKIIITMRNQLDVLNSSYKQYVKNGGVMKIDTYLGLQPQRDHSMLDKAYFDYYTIYKKYIEIFGKDNVLLLQYENMKSSEYMQKLNAFVGNSKMGEIKTGKVNASISVGKTNMLRWINHFTYNTHRPSQLISNRITTSKFFFLLKKLPNRGGKSFMTQRRKDEVESFYRTNNQLLIKEFSMDLHPSYPQ